MAGKSYDREEAAAFLAAQTQAKAATGFNGRQRQQLAQGGQRVHQESGSSEIYERKGEKRERITASGYKNRVRFIMSNRIQLDGKQRAVANYYGASVEQLMIGLSTEFCPVYVDSSSNSGASDHLLIIAERVAVAEAALNSMRLLRYKPRSRQLSGQHGAIPTRVLIDAVCVFGTDLTEVGLRYGWWVERAGKRSVPNQQSQKLKCALEDGLGAIQDAWMAIGFEVSADMVNVEIG